MGDRARGCGGGTAPAPLREPQRRVAGALPAHPPRSAARPAVLHAQPGAGDARLPVPVQLLLGVHDQPEVSPSPRRRRRRRDRRAAGTEPLLHRRQPLHPSRLHPRALRRAGAARPDVDRRSVDRHRRRSRAARPRGAERHGGAARRLRVGRAGLAARDEQAPHERRRALHPPGPRAAVARRRRARDVHVRLRPRRARRVRPHVRLLRGGRPLRRVVRHPEPFPARRRSTSSRPRDGSGRATGGSTISSISFSTCPGGRRAPWKPASTRSSDASTRRVRSSAAPRACAATRGCCGPPTCCCTPP